jgi:hypothetical protein
MRESEPAKRTRTVRTDLIYEPKWDYWKKQPGWTLLETVLLVCNDPEDKVFLREFIDCYWELEPRHRDVYDKAGTQCTRVYLEEPLPKAGIKKALSKRQPKKVPGKRQPWYPDPEDVRPDFCEVPWPLPSCYSGLKLYEKLARAAKVGTLKATADEYARPADLLAFIENLSPRYMIPPQVESMIEHGTHKTIPFPCREHNGTEPMKNDAHRIMQPAHTGTVRADDVPAYYSLSVSTTRVWDHLVNSRKRQTYDNIQDALSPSMGRNTICKALKELRSHNLLDPVCTKGVLPAARFRETAETKLEPK